MKNRKDDDNYYDYDTNSYEDEQGEQEEAPKRKKLKVPENYYEDAPKDNAEETYPQIPKKIQRTNRPRGREQEDEEEPDQDELAETPFIYPHNNRRFEQQVERHGKILNQTVNRFSDRNNMDNRQLQNENQKLRQNEVRLKSMLENAKYTRMRNIAVMFVPNRNMVDHEETFHLEDDERSRVKLAVFNKAPNPLKKMLMSFQGKHEMVRVFNPKLAFYTPDGLYAYFNAYTKDQILPPGMLMGSNNKDDSEKLEKLVKESSEDVNDAVRNLQFITDIANRIKYDTEGFLAKVLPIMSIFAIIFVGLAILYLASSLGGISQGAGVAAGTSAAKETVQLLVNQILNASHTGSITGNTLP